MFSANSDHFGANVLLYKNSARQQSKETSVSWSEFLCFCGQTLKSALDFLLVPNCLLEERSPPRFSGASFNQDFLLFLRAQSAAQEWAVACRALHGGGGEGGGGGGGVPNQDFTVGFWLNAVELSV